MITLSQIRGQDRALAILRRAIAGDRVAHAYLFCGPAHVGKHTTGVALAAALNCLDAPGEGCGRCEACRKIAGAHHPDVQTLQRQGAAQIIPIQTIRTQVIPRLASPPHEGKARVFLIEEATSLQGPSANALLKTLEEPPARTHFVLCTTSPDQLLPTIRSRCQRINFGALSVELRAELASELGGDDAAVRAHDIAATLHAAALAHDIASVHDAAREASAAKAELSAALAALAERFHADAVAAANHNQLDHAVIASRRAMVVLDIHAAVMQQAHGQLSVEAMLHRLRAVWA